MLSLKLPKRLKQTPTIPDQLSNHRQTNFLKLVIIPCGSRRKLSGDPPHCRSKGPPGGNRPETPPPL